MITKKIDYEQENTTHPIFESCNTLIGKTSFNNYIFYSDTNSILLAFVQFAIGSNGRVRGVINQQSKILIGDVWDTNIEGAI